LDFRKGKCCFATLSSTYLIFYFNHLHRIFYTTVDFYSTECPPCEALASKFESLADVYGDDIKFVKIHRQENRDLAVSLGVSSSPTLLFYENGEQKGKRLSGGIKRSEIVENLELLISNEKQPN
jgi:thioredoxin reductase (NADPH)